MKRTNILWVNPSFLDYRVPFYKELNLLCGGGLYLAYSENRVPQRCRNKIHTAIGINALGLMGEKRFSFGAVKTDLSCRSVSFPYPKGLSSLISSINADIVISEGFFQWTPWALQYAKKRKIPVMIAYERTKHTERTCPMWRTLYRRLINKFVSGYLVNGSLCKQYLVDSIRVHDKPIIEGVMAADSDELASKCEQYKRAMKTEETDSGLIYIYVGRLVERKGVNYLIEAWKKHEITYPNDRLMIIGDGEERHRLESIATKSVVFKGSVDYDSIHCYYAQADVFIIPTLEDNWSLVVPEAMACGLPIACSCYNGCYPELVKEGENGVIFDPLKQDSIIKALGYFHDVDLFQLGQKSVAIEQGYSPKKCAARAYEGICTVLKMKEN